MVAAISQSRVESSEIYRPIIAPHSAYLGNPDKLRSCPDRPERRIGTMDKFLSGSAAPISITPPKATIFRTALKSFAVISGRSVISEQ
jgi:hypothetical protein